MPKMLTPKQAAPILNVSERTVRRWCEEGVFGDPDSIRHSGRWRIPRERILRLAREGIATAGLSVRRERSSTDAGATVNPEASEAKAVAMHEWGEEEAEPHAPTKIFPSLRYCVEPKRSTKMRGKAGRR